MSNELIAETFGLPLPLILSTLHTVILHLSAGLLILCVVVCDVHGKVTLTKGRTETVSFEGGKLTIVVDNTLGRGDDLKICFGSSPGVAHPLCPAGYARLSVEVNGHEEMRLTVNRQGQVFKAGAVLSTLGTIKLNNEGTLNITVAKLPDAKTTVTRPNAATTVQARNKAHVQVLR
uniref:DUF2807 domain-containing protein n=1 Tax=Panagrellus redivivus TaxID=6233 RepID=A0A7E4ZUW1_PANRE